MVLRDKQVKRAARRLWQVPLNMGVWELADKGRRQRWQGQEGEATTAPNAIAAAAPAASGRYMHMYMYGMGGDLHLFRTRKL